LAARRVDFPGGAFLTSLLTFLVPPIAAFVLAFALYLTARERAARVGLAPLVITALFCWVFIVRPGWVPVDDATRVLHVAVGAALLGLALDAVKPPRFAAAVLVAGFLLGSAFASVTGRIMPGGPISVRDGAITSVLAVVSFLVLARFDAMHERALNLSILLALLGGGLALLAAIAHDPVLTGLALVMAMALAGYVVFVAVTGTSVGDGVILFSGASMLAMVWALAQRHPDLRLALLCLPLVLFAEATALRVPLPAARISTLLYPLIFAGLVCLPLGLAGLIAFVTSIP
jgi:hypothetical protein